MGMWPRQRRSSNEKSPGKPGLFPVVSGHLGQFASQRLFDQRAGFVDAIKRDEGAETWSAFLADQHFIEHLEEGNRNAGTAFRAFLGVVLITLNGTGDVKNGVLDVVAISAGRQRCELRIQCFKGCPFHIIRRAELLGRLHEIVEVADRIADERIEFRIVFRRNARHVARDETPQHSRISAFDALTRLSISAKVTGRFTFGGLP